MVSLKLGRAPFIGWKDKTPLLSEGFLREFKMKMKGTSETSLHPENQSFC
jgi:hypothetical protein